MASEFKISKKIAFNSLVLILSGMLYLILTDTHHELSHDGINAYKVTLKASSFGPNQYQFVGNKYRSAVVNIPAAIVPLSIRLTNFELKSENGQVQIKWSTSSEKNNDYFMVQRSKDGVHFSDIIKINGAGNSNMVFNYEAYDDSPYSGASYYRLNQTNYDGQNSIFEMQSIEIDEELNEELFVITAYPTQRDHKFKIISTSNQIEQVAISVYNAQRNCVAQFPPTQLGKNTLEMEITLPKNILPGTYIAEINSVTHGKILQKLMVN